MPMVRIRAISVANLAGPSEKRLRSRAFLRGRQGALQGGYIPSVAILDAISVTILAALQKNDCASVSVAVKALHKVDLPGPREIKELIKFLELYN